jgi:two-component system response regulator NreC
LRKLLSEQPDIEVIGEASDGNEAITKAIELIPDVLLIDITMPGLGGIDAIRVVKARIPKVAVVVLTMHEDEGHFLEALKAGASAYIPKKAADTELLAAIRAVQDGEVYIHHSFDRALATRILYNEGSDRVETVDSYDRLSQREQQILKLVAQGFTNQQIAAQLFLSVKTVETYKTRVMRKLNLLSRVELVRFALKRNLLASEP